MVDFPIFLECQMPSTKNAIGRSRSKADLKEAEHRPDREGTKTVSVHANRTTADEFKILAIRNKVTSEALMHVGLAASFAMFGQKLPAPLRDKLREEGLYDRFIKFARLQHD
jgi:hypothetical protein